MVPQCPPWVSNKSHRAWDLPLGRACSAPGCLSAGGTRCRCISRPLGLNCKRKPMEKRWKNHGFRNVLSMNWIWKSGIGDFFERNNILLQDGRFLDWWRWWFQWVECGWYNSFNPSGLVLFTHQSHNLTSLRPRASVVAFLQSRYKCHKNACSGAHGV